MISRIRNSLINYMIKKTARNYGFLDPMKLLGQLNRFAQPSSVLVPTELLRSGALLQARGLINSQAIQHNLDWLWPFWVRRQFDPIDISFIPRAFSLTHINLTHRNWTAIGLPGCSQTPIVDPRGLLTPFWDGWSLDCWIVHKDREDLIPSQMNSVDQKIHINDQLAVSTCFDQKGSRLLTWCFVERQEGEYICRMDVTAQSFQPAWLAVSLRPYNPEGVSFIHTIERLKDIPGWCVNQTDQIEFSCKPQQYSFSDYRQGDVYHRLLAQPDRKKIKCDVGMATAAALFDLSSEKEKSLAIQVPLKYEKTGKVSFQKQKPVIQTWGEALKERCALEIPDQQSSRLYEIALRTMVLHASDKLYAGPYTYKRFWFRDAVFICYAFLCAGLKEKAWEMMNQFERRQKANGYFESQEGEWDSNGQVLWLLEKYCQLTGENLPDFWKAIIKKAARWIIRKRLVDDINALHAGLMPAGFSAEHLGPNDYYYWDNFWSVAGLRYAASLMERFQEWDEAKGYRQEAEALMSKIEKSLQAVAQRLSSNVIPASIYRRMDSGAVGSLVAGYPLQLFGEKDQRLTETVEYLYRNCLVDKGFFHDMSHSGINPYLTLHIAQVMLRGGDIRFFDLMQAIRDLASETGQWPEAIHPITKGGCMGDGQHVWAAAEWTLMMRNCFVREDGCDRSLILCQGIMPQWYANQREISFGWTPTSLGNLKVKLQTYSDKIIISWDGRWHDREPLIDIRLPGFQPVLVPSGSHQKVIFSPQGIES